MKDFPSCFGENGVQIFESSSSSTNKSSAAQNLVTFVYRYQSQSFSDFLTVTWIKYLTGQGLSIGVENSSNDCLCKVDIKTWMFSKRKGSKHLVVNSMKIDIHWDLSSAKLGPGPEPLEGFYIAISLNQELALFVGDLENEFSKKIDSSSLPFVSRAILVAKRMNIFGKRYYNAKAQFCDKGKLHDIRIEYNSSEGYDKSISIYIDSKLVLQVMNLKWKFRGNESILVDGISIEVYWDVYSWLFGSLLDNAIFLFRSRFPGEKACGNQSSIEGSALSWPALHGSNDSSYSQVHGFSLVLCAWKNE